MAATQDLDAYYAFDAGAGSGVPTEDVWEEHFKHVLLDGVMAGEPSGTTPGTTELQVYGDSTGLQVKVRVGRGLMKGHAGWTTAEKTLPIATADATNPRIDAVVLRLDRTNNKMQLVVIDGTPAVSPSPPSITQTSVIHDELLAYVNVAAGAVTISSANVTDKRRWAIPDARGWPTAKLVRTADLTGIASGVDTAVAFEAAPYLTGGFAWSASDATKLYVPRAGLYRFTGRVRWAVAGAGARQATLQRNGTDPFGLTLLTVSSTAEYVLEVNGDVVCATNDYVQLLAFQTSGTAVTLEFRSYAPQLHGLLLRPTT